MSNRRAQHTKDAKAIEETLQGARDAFARRLLGTKSVEVNIRDYTFLRLLGKGGYGSVYKASSAGGEVVAIKIQNKAEIRGKERGIAKVLNESRFLRGCNCVFIVGVLGTWQSATHLALVMEYAAYGDMSQLSRDGPATERKILYYVAQAICALEYLHAVNLIYCDLKPENCLISERGRIKIGDFGLTIHAASRFRGIRGTYFYMAPEILDNEIYTESVDWWAFGVMIFKLLLDASPFRGLTDSRETMTRNILKGNILGLHRARISSNAKDLIYQLLTRDPRRRIGVGPVGLDRLKKHPWFKNVDFPWLWSDEFVNPEFDLKEVEGRGCDPNVFHDDPPEDPKLSAFKGY